MKFKGIMLITLVLLVVLTMGAISASEDISQDDNLTVIETGGVQNTDITESPQGDEILSNDEEVDSVQSSADESILGDDITSQDFGSWVSSHSPKGNYWEHVVAISPNEVTEGNITVSIGKFNGSSQTYEKNVCEINEDGNVVWQLSELEIIDEVGSYIINVTYNNELTLINQATFALTQMNFNIMEGELYYECPFEVIKVYSENFDVEVYVNGSKCINGEENQLSWTLSDLGIYSLGDYNITLVTYEKGDVVDNFTYTLNIVDNVDWFRAYAPFEVETDDLENPVLYLYSPNNQIGESISIFIGEDFFKNVTVESNWMSWNLTNLGIEENNNFNVRFKNDDGYLCDVWVNVQGIINENSFHPWVSSHEQVSTDWDPDVAGVDVDENIGEGKIDITISNDEGVVFTGDKYIGEDDIRWTLDELRKNNILKEVGSYTIAFKYVNGDDEIDLGEYVFTLTNYNYNTMENELYIDYPFEIIKVYDEVNVEVYVNGKLCSAKDELSWTLSDLNITSLGDYNITIVAYDDGKVMDNFTFTLNLVDSIDWFRAYAPFEVETDDLENPVLYLYSPNNQIGESISIFIGEDFFKNVTVESNWMNWTLSELEIEKNGEYNINFENEDGYLCDTGINVRGFKELNVELWGFDEGTIYADTVGTVISIYRDEDLSGMLDIIVNNTVIYHTIFTYENHFEVGFFDAYEWDLKSLGITEAGIYNVTLKFVGDEDELINEYIFDVVDFDNSTFRAQLIGEDDERLYLYLFTPYGETGTVSLTFTNWDDELQEDVFVGNATLKLNESYWNRWVMIPDYLNYGTFHVEIIINDEEIDVEYSYPKDTGNEFIVTDGEIYSGEDIVLWVVANTTDNSYTINITNGNDSFIANVSGLSDYEWFNGRFKYYITLDDLSSLTFNDKDKVTITYDTGNLKSLSSRWSPAAIYVVVKNDSCIRLYDYWSIRIDLIKIELAYNEEEEEQDENYQFDDNQLVRITVPDSLNIHQTAIVHITYGDNEITKNLSELYNEYNYNNLAVDYYLLLNDLDLKKLKNKDILNVSVTSADELIGSRNFIMFADNEEGWRIDYFADSISLILYYGTIGNLEYGLDGDPDQIISLTIPEYLNITEGTVIITDENGTVIFSKLLSEFEENCTDYDGQTYGYWISDNVEEFDYSIFEENVPFAVSFAYGNTTKVYARGIREGNELHRITTPENVADFFKVTLSEGILINDSDNAIIIEPTDNANLQSVGIDLGGGWFVVYVNGVKVENLGRLVGFDNETELELYLLQRGSGDGTNKLIIYLSDLNITDNGEYNIRVTHQPENNEDEVTSSSIESELFNQNITLTSNVKVDNVTSGALTGFGMDPILLYLDTYYGDINETSGKITVLNSDGDEIFTSNIKSLSKDDASKYYLKYSDFKNKNFGDSITVMYSDGNERSGNTTVNVTWKDVDSDVFNPVVNDDVDDYYGDFINLEIPDLLTTGQIIVTLKFKGNHTTNLPIDVSSDFGSEAVYRFNVAEIKTNYPDGFKLSLSDLGFYEDDGNYDVDVKFTANGVDTLNVTNNTLNVAFSDDIIISINETLRYTYKVPFASVKVFEPTNAYVDLYIDGVLYLHKTVFEDGLITFISSGSWASGNHTAEIRVIQSEFDRLLNSSTVQFKVLAQTDDVMVSVNDNVKENEHVIISITVPKAGNVTIDDKPYELNAGLNTIDLGTLKYGNHTMWVLYEEELDDGNITFYNNYVSVFVGDDGHWLSVPDPLVLKNDDTIKMNLGEGVTGYVLVYLDEKLIANKTLVNGQANFTITDEMFSEDYVPDLLGTSNSKTKYGKHTYKIVYSGDATHDNLTQTGEFTIAYLFKDDIPPENPLKENYDITITLPADARGTVRLTVNNKPYTSQVKDGKASFKVDNLTFGAHDVFIEYIGDDYPYSSYNTLLNISYYEIMGEYSADAKFVSLMLPANATGNLTVVNTNIRNEKYDLFSLPISGDITKIDLSALPVGVYNLLAYYDGSDYDVKSFAVDFKVMPTVIIAQDTVIGENLTIFVDLDNSTGSLLIILDGLSPVLEQIIDGKINYTMSTEGYSYGNHSVTFYYVGTSFDGNVFNEGDTTTGYSNLIKYGVEILPIKVLPKDESDNDAEYLIYMYDEEGNFLADASGQIEVTVLDRLTGQYRNYVLDVVNGIARLSLSGLKDGDYSLSWKYLGDKKYGSFSKALLLSVKHKVAKITAADLNMQYTSGKTYTVTVYTKDGKLAGGVAVSFLINNKAYGNVITKSNGVASIAINSAPGSYQITSSALGVSITKKLTVSKIISLKTVKVKRSSKKLVLKATLKKVNGKYLKGKKITFKFNGKKYTAKTNKKGVAKVTIKKNVLKKLKKGKKVTYQATYLKDTVKKTAKVKK